MDNANLAVGQASFLTPSSPTASNNLMSIRVTNRGPEGDDNVHLTAAFPPILTLLSCSVAGTTCLLSGNSLRIDYAQLAPGDSVQASVTVNVSGGLANGTIVGSTINVRSDTNDLRQADNLALPALMVAQNNPSCNFAAS